MKFNYLNMIVESKSNTDKKITFNYNSYDKQYIKKMITDLFGKNSGNIIIDPDSSDPAIVSTFSLNSKIDVDLDLESDNTKATITLDNSDERMVDVITKFVRLLGEYGNGGHSYSIKFIPNSSKAKIKSFGWDGDGSDRIDIDSIKVDNLNKSTESNNLLDAFDAHTKKFEEFTANANEKYNIKDSSENANDKITYTNAKDYYDNKEPLSMDNLFSSGFEKPYFENVRDFLHLILENVRGIGEKSFNDLDNLFAETKEKFISESEIISKCNDFESKECRPQYCAEVIYEEYFK